MILSGCDELILHGLKADCTIRIFDVMFSQKTTPSKSGKSHPSPRQYTHDIIPES